jgi:hypothetical protein
MNEKNIRIGYRFTEKTEERKTQRNIEILCVWNAGIRTHDFKGTN